MINPVTGDHFCPVGGGKSHPLTDADRAGVTLIACSSPADAPL